MKIFLEPACCTNLKGESESGQTREEVTEVYVSGPVGRKRNG